jgi:hypothetical protein
VSALLYSAGEKAQRVYSNEMEGVEMDQNELTVDFVINVFDTVFNRQSSDVFQRRFFRKMKQEPGERITTFIARLKDQLKWCQISSVEEEESLVRDQVININ